MATFKAIKSKKLKLPTRVLPQAQKILTDFQREGVREASRYPAQKPPTDPTRKAYKRTGSLGRSWSRESGIVGQGRTLTARVISAPGTAPYNIHVVGPKTGPKGKPLTTATVPTAAAVQARTFGALAPILATTVTADGTWRLDDNVDGALIIPPGCRRMGLDSPFTRL